jgi:hypothetical protein
MDPKARLIQNSFTEVTADLVGTTDLLAPGGVPANASFVVIESEVLALDPDGATRIVNLPPTTGLRGAQVTIVNSADAAESIQLVDEANGATMVTIAQNESGTVRAGDSVWYNVGVGKAT